VNEPTPGSKRRLTKIAAAVEAAVKEIPPIDDFNQALPALEETSLERDQARSALEKANEELADMRLSRSLRERYANWAFAYLVCFTVFCMTLVVAQGFPDVPFKLSDNVIITLVGSTAVAAIGLVGWIARGLFKAPGS
jgi:hypothetical protein